MSDVELNLKPESEDRSKDLKIGLFPMTICSLQLKGELIRFSRCSISELLEHFDDPERKVLARKM